MDLSAVTWRTSSYSSGGGNECVEVAVHRRTLAIRDSKDPDGPALLVDAGIFRDLTARIKNGDHHS